MKTIPFALAFPSLSFLLAPLASAAAAGVACQAKGKLLSAVAQPTDIATISRADGLELGRNKGEQLASSEGDGNSY
jgi:hypothetical protein